MKFQPFIAPTLLAQGSGGGRFFVPIQLTLMPDDQPPLVFALRLHDATRLHFDLRFRILKTLFSLVLIDPPSLDPSRITRAKLMADHDPNYIDSERRIPLGQPGAGPTMPVDRGGFYPLVQTHTTHELEALNQIAQGDFRFVLSGQHLKGGWQLKRRDLEHWDLRKLADEHASTTRVLRLDRSVVTGKTLADL